MLRFFVLTFLVCVKLNAQKLEHLTHHITAEQGIPDKEVYQIAEDKKGFIWIATNSGLYRYDGVDFSLYRHQNQKKSSVFGLLFDHEDRLWFNTLNGQYFYIEDDTVVFFDEYLKETKELLRSFSIYDNTLYVSFNNKVLGVDINSKKSQKTHFKLNIETSISGVTKFKDSLFVVDTQKMHNINTTTKIINKDYRVSSRTVKLNEGILVHSIGEKNLNQFTIVNKKGSFIVSGLDAIQETNFHGFKQMHNLLWIFTSKGAFIYNLKNNIATLQNTFLKGKDVTDALVDSRNNLWITTLNYGIYVLQNTSFYTIVRPDKEEYITDFITVNDSIVAYIEGRRKLVRFNTNNLQSQTRILKNFNQKLYYNRFSDKIYAFVGPEVYIFNNSERFDIHKKSKLGVPKDIINTSDNELLLSHYNRLKLYNSDTGKEEVYFSGRCNKLAFNRKNKHIYVGFSKGLRAGRSVKSIKNVSYNNKEVFIKSIVVKPNSTTVFTTTHNNKILKLIENKVVDSILLKQQHSINSLASDNNYLWISTDKGVIRYEYTTKKIRKLKSIAATQVKEIELTQYFAWILTDTKIIRIPKNYKDVKNTSVLPYFTTVKIDGNRVNFNKRIEVLNNTQNISVSFMINGFKTLEEYYFEYQLSGKKWQKLSSNQLTLSSLPFDEQKLSIRAVHKETGQMSASKSIYFWVIRPFYKTWWFLSFMVLLASLIMILLIRRGAKIQQQKKEKELQQVIVKQQLTNLKLENLRSQMNPHFIFNALNSIQEYIYTNEKKLATSYLVKFSRLIRIYLDHSRVSEVTLAKEIAALELYLYLERDRFNETLDYAILVDDTVNTEKIKVPSLLLQPYVENAIKHGLLHKKGNRKLIIQFSYNHEKTAIVAVIRDNGIGREASAEINKNRNYSSFSTKANASRVDLMNIERSEKITLKIIDLKDNSNNSIGTEIHFSIPV